MALDLDDAARTKVLAAFSFYGLYPSHVHTDGALDFEGADCHKLITLWSRAESVREVAARRGADAAAAHAEAVVWDEPVSTRVPDGVAVLDGRRASVPSTAVLDVAVGVDLAVRLDSLAEAGDPAEELRFLLQAGERGDYSELGEQVAALADIYSDTLVR